MSCSLGLVMGPDRPKARQASAKILLHGLAQWLRTMSGL